jgi:hypothetical protein
VGSRRECKVPREKPLLPAYGKGHDHWRGEFFFGFFTVGLRAAFCFTALSFRVFLPRWSFFDFFKATA